MHYKLLRMGGDGNAAKGGCNIIQQSNIVNGREDRKMEEEIQEMPWMKKGPNSADNKNNSSVRPVCPSSHIFSSPLLILPL
jgi:hypothetical protein